MTLMVSRSAASFHSDVKAAADVAPFAVAAAHVFAAFAASVADGAVPSAVFSSHRHAAALPVGVRGLVAAAASAAPVLASGTAYPVAGGISGRSLDFRCSAVCPNGLALANRWDERSLAG